MSVQLSSSLNAAADTLRSVVPLASAGTVLASVVGEPAIKSLITQIVVALLVKAAASLNAKRKARRAKRSAHVA